MKILIVGPSWVGDSVISQSLFKIIFSIHQEICIDVLAPEWTMDIYQRMKEINHAHKNPFNHGEIKIGDRRAFGNSIRVEEYDQAIVLPNSLKSALIPFFAKIPLRTGWRGEMRYALINDIRILDKSMYPRMLDRFVALALEESAELPSNIPFPSLSVNKENLDLLIEKFNINPSLPLICLCPGAEFGPAKRWPADYYAEVANEYLKKKWQVIVLGSPNDKSVGEEITMQVKEQSGFLNLIGETKLKDVVDILSSASLVLTNDSGLMHVAASVDVPLVALYGPTSPEFTPPLSNKVKVIKKSEGFSKLRIGNLKGGYHKGLRDIQPKEVLATLSGFES